MKLLLGILFLLAAVSCGGGILLTEDPYTELACCIGIFGGGVFYGVLAGGGGKR